MELLLPEVIGNFLEIWLDSERGGESINTLVNFIA